MIDISNPVKVLNDTVKAGVEFIGDTVKGGTKTLIDIGTKAGLPLAGFLDATLLQPKPFEPIFAFPGIIDIIKNLPTTAPGSSLGPEYQGLMDDLGGLNDQIAKKREELANAKPEDRNTIALELQGLLQERLQLISTVSNLLKQENDAAMAVINNLRG